MCNHTDLRHALGELELLGTSGRHDFLEIASLETGGYFHEPERANNWDSQMVEIKAHDISADGSDLVEAIRNWMLVAGGQARILQQVERAKHLLFQPGVDPDTLRDACNTIINDGKNPSICNAARTTLAGLDAPDARA